MKCERVGTHRLGLGCLMYEHEKGGGGGHLDINLGTLTVNPENYYGSTSCVVILFNHNHCCRSLPNFILNIPTND